MPVFPNFPQKFKHQKERFGSSIQISAPFKHIKTNTQLKEKAIFTNNFTPLKQSKVLSPKEQSILENFTAHKSIQPGRDNEKPKVGFKRFENSDFIPERKDDNNSNHPPFLPFQQFSPNPFEIITKKSQGPISPT